jgi:hypothetical protein
MVGNKTNPLYPETEKDSKFKPPSLKAFVAGLSSIVDCPFTGCSQ